jgi:probable F420-dependent oxidoreductase
MICSAGLPTCMEGMMYPVPFATPEDVVEIARHAEALGFHSVWGNDHMTTQKYVRETFAQAPNFWEPLVTYAFVAAATKHLRVGTGMLVTPMRRDVVVLAKQLATLDQFSGGRLILGIGVGAYREEFEALHPGWKVHRGEMVQESIQALRCLFEQRVASWQGKYYQYRDVEMFPKPYQDPLPIYIGGNSVNAVKRTARYADGWLPAGMSASLLRERIDYLEELLQVEGRTIDDVDVAVQFIAYVGKTHEAAVEHFEGSQMYRHLVSLSKSTLKDQAGANHAEINLIGAVDELVAKATRLAEVGVKHLCGLYFCAEDVRELKDQMQIFAEEVMPALRSV